jgi:hypothetical protein
MTVRVTDWPGRITEGSNADIVICSKRCSAAVTQIATIATSAGAISKLNTTPSSTCMKAGSAASQGKKGDRSCIYVHLVEAAPVFQYLSYPRNCSRREA